jgi:hypothetical protein
LSDFRGNLTITDLRLYQIFVVYVLVRVVIDQNRTEEGREEGGGGGRGEDKKVREGRRGKSCAVLCYGEAQRLPCSRAGTVMQD